MSERVPHFVTSLLQLYKRQGGGAVLEITLCLSPLLHLAVTTSASPALDTVLDPLFNTMFQQVCIPMDFERPGTVKNHHEMLRCYDTMMRHSPSKLVQGFLVKADSGEERLRVGALMVIKHILNMSTAELGEQLEAILEHLAAKLQETNPNVQKVLAQIIVLLGSHGSISGARGRDLVAFIVRLCGAEDSKPTTLTTESLGVICSNILELLWPHTLDALLQVGLLMPPHSSILQLTQSSSSIPPLAPPHIGGLRGRGAGGGEGAGPRGGEEGGGGQEHHGGLGRLHACGRPLAAAGAAGGASRRALARRPRRPHPQAAPPLLPQHQPAPGGSLGG